MNKVRKLAEIFAMEGKRLYIVGGAARDMVLGRIPHDYDLATNCTPAETMAIIENNGFAVLPIAGAIEHGVVFSMVENEQFEIASFRGDGNYTDGRHCDVTFGVSLEEDLKRRDFTMNAMAINPLTNEVVDIHGGAADIKAGIIRTVGDAHERFNEDALRVFRAARFAAQLGFQVDANIIDAANAHIDGLKAVSGERMNAEITKLLTSKNPETGINILRKMGVLAAVLPEVENCFTCEQNNPHHVYNVGEHLVKSLNASASRGTNDAITAWAMLLHDIGKPSVKECGSDGFDHFKGHAVISSDMTEDILKRLHFSRNESAKILFLIKFHDSNFNSLATAKKWVGKYGSDFCKALMEVRRCDILAQNPNHCFDKKMAMVDTSEAFVNEAISLNEAMTIKDLEINGKDLIAVGVKPGPDMGRILNALLDAVLNDASLNNRDSLLSLVKEVA